MATSLEILKKNFRSVIYTKTLSYGVQIAKIARGLCFAYDRKSDAMATSLKESKRGPDRENSRKYLSFGEKIVKIGLVDSEIICLKLKKKKLTQAKYIALSASLPSRLNKSKCLQQIDNK